jgi:hypothetical protein
MFKSVKIIIANTRFEDKKVNLSVYFCDVAVQVQEKFGIETTIPFSSLQKPNLDMELTPYGDARPSVKDFVAAHEHYKKSFG